MVLQESRCAYGIIIMAVFWMTETIPMAVTALLPVVIMPWLGVIGSKALCKNYLKVRVKFYFVKHLDLFCKKSLFIS